MVSEGTPATFVITASAASAQRPHASNLDAGGTATSNDIVTPPSSVTLPANATSVQVTVPTRVDNVVKPKKTLTLALDGGTGLLGRLAGLGADDDRQQQRAGRAHHRRHHGLAGRSATLTVTADQAPLHDTQVSLSFAGDADARHRLPHASNPVARRCRAGHTSASVTVSTLSNDVIQPDRHIVVSITPSPASYSVGSPGHRGDHDPAARPATPRSRS